MPNPLQFWRQGPREESPLGLSRKSDRQFPAHCSAKAPGNGSLATTKFQVQEVDFHSLCRILGSIGGLIENGKLNHEEQSPGASRGSSAIATTSRARLVVV